MSKATLPISRPLVIWQGATFRQAFRWSLGGVGVDLTGWTAHMQVRRFPAAATPIVDLTDGNGITLGADGSVTVVIDAAASAALPALRGVYDLRLTRPDGEVVPFLTGVAIVAASVTRDVAP